VSLFFIFTQDA